MSIALITAREHELTDFRNGLEQNGSLDVHVFSSGMKAMDAAATTPFSLAVVDDGLPDLLPLDMVMGLMRVSATINTAVISPMDKKEFHEKSEGLGILLHLPAKPEAKDAAKLLQLLGEVGAM